jgi:transcriptional regulator with XRE-family HTH domain
VSEIDKICSRLKQLRQRHGVSQERFAEIAGMSYKYYQHLEAGRKRRILLETVERLGEAYGIEAWQIIGPELPENTRLKEISRG